MTLHTFPAECCAAGHLPLLIDISQLHAGEEDHTRPGQHQDVDKTLCGRFNQNDRGQR